MNNTAIKIGAIASASILAGTGAAAVLQGVAGTHAVMPMLPTTALAQESTEVASAYMDVANVQGIFSFDQTTTTPNEQIAGTFRKATSILCDSNAAPRAVSVDKWQVEVTGDVTSGYTATLTEAAKSTAPVSRISTCSCRNNLPGGTAIATAQIEGIAVADLLSQAAPSDDVNAVIFSASDGAQLALPLDYVLDHASMLVYSANGAALDESFGGTNQLWIEGAAGQSFLRDIVKVEFVACDEASMPQVPEMIETDLQYVNRPNVSIQR